MDTPLAPALLDGLLSEASKGGGFHARKEAVLHARLNKVSGGVLLRGDVSCEVLAPCKRCLRETSVTVPVNFTLNLVPQSLLEGGNTQEGEDDGGAESTGSFGLQDADREPFDGKVIDLDPIVREQVLLALPLTVVCQEDCRGLCTVCGQNLNEKECGCERKIVDPRLMALKNIKL